MSLKQVKNVPRIGIVCTGVDSNIIVTDSANCQHNYGQYSNKIPISVGHDNRRK